MPSSIRSGAGDAGGDSGGEIKRLRVPKDVRVGTTRTLLTLGLGLTALLVACSGGSTGSRGTTATTAAQTASTAVTLHGFVYWGGEMPTAPSSPSPGASVNPFDLPTPMPYDSASAQDLCHGSSQFGAAPSEQIVVHGPNGDTLGVGSVNVTTLGNGQTPTQTDQSNNNGADFTCTLAWDSPALPRLISYTIDLNGRSTVVNGSAADQPIYLPL